MGEIFNYLKLFDIDENNFIFRSKGFVEVI